ncbi:MAG: YhfC family intramembrane metalloprotease [Oscillospiraceae bacterium]|nr:YhfC family intramembrane metalloprotease [Oscillospiraceae bacterium]
MISNASIAVMIGGIALICVMVICLMLYYKFKYHTKITTFLIGAATFILFALVLEQLMHVLVLFKSPVGDTIQNNIWLYALYGGLAAGVFEETGRLIAMKFLLKKEHRKPHTALMYGAGHGGIEALLLGGLSLLSNLIYSFMINAGQEQMLLSQIPAEQLETVQESFKQLKEASPALFAAIPAERVSAVTLHIALSVLVWTAVVKKKPTMYMLAILLHFLLDAVAVLLKDKIPIAALELLLFVISVLTALLAYAVWKKHLAGGQQEAVPEGTAIQVPPTDS